MESARLWVDRKTFAPPQQRKKYLQRHLVRESVISRPRPLFPTKSGFHIGDGVNFFDDVKERSGPFYDAHQLGVRFNFDVDIKKPAVDVKKNMMTSST